MIFFIIYSGLRNRIKRTHEISVVVQSASIGNGFILANPHLSEQKRKKAEKRGFLRPVHMV